jgi:hypothetical protein
MAKKRLNLDEIVGGTFTVADLRLLLTGAEVICLAKLVKYVFEHEDQFGDEESTAAGTTADMVLAAQLLEQALIDEGFSYREGGEESA